MTGQEGLRGWADRKVCLLRYGIDFYVPESVDFARSKSSDYANSLLVVSVKKKSSGIDAGILNGDRIVGVDDQARAGQISYAELLENLAVTGNDGTTLYIKRDSENITLRLGRYSQDRL